jgi:hypothetical protein
MNKIEFDELPEFKRDLKNLLKKYRTLKEDLEVVKLDLNDEPGESPPFSFRIDHLALETCVIKIKKIACKALKPELDSKLPSRFLIKFDGIGLFSGFTESIHYN